ncbi:hypothetical protein XOC_1363 [Xanthomonas oryzae pv. oryzicola BLS256]|uniref:Uncharacterized protein n=1 Tax=Xanthomonas oryzae pv. oryzicola (strain BLS256) TaxID=383407 RepID=G7TI29_XANOB|nr:hypothetical protein XOC_1363 [Xanthomonas oryzae pv. oryzicola BLS256]
MLGEGDPDSPAEFRPLDNDEFHPTRLVGLALAGRQPTADDRPRCLRRGLAPERSVLRNRIALPEIGTIRAALLVVDIHHALPKGTQGIVVVCTGHVHRAATPLFQRAYACAWTRRRHNGMPYEYDSQAGTPTDIAGNIASRFGSDRHRWQFGDRRSFRVARMDPHLYVFWSAGRSKRRRGVIVTAHVPAPYP